MFTFPCEQCNQEISVPDEKAGKAVRCPHCEAIVAPSNVARAPRKEKPGLSTTRNVLSELLREERSSPAMLNQQSPSPSPYPTRSGSDGRLKPLLKTCRHCKGEIPDESQTCQYCGKSQEATCFRPAKSSLAQRRDPIVIPWKKIALAGLVIVAVAVFVAINASRRTQQKEEPGQTPVVDAPAERSSEPPLATAPTTPVADPEKEARNTISQPGPVLTSVDNTRKEAREDDTMARAAATNPDLGSAPGVPAVKPELFMVKEDEHSVSALLNRADGEQNIAKAWTLYQQAREQNPKTLDVLKAMARRFQDCPDHKLYGQSLGYILALDVNNVMALNNAGVVAALDKNWAQAIRNLGKAAIGDLGDLPSKNLSQAVYMTHYAEETDQNMVRKGDSYGGMSEAQLMVFMRSRLATLAAQDQIVVRQVVDNIHKNKRHLNEDLWCGSWIPKKDADDIRGNNETPMKKIRNEIYLIRGIIAGNDRLDTTLNRRMAVYKLIADLQVVPDSPAVLPPAGARRLGSGRANNPGELVLIDETGSAVKSVLP
jgi:hypothetical protein